MKISYFNESRAPIVIFREQAYFDILKMMGSTFAKDKEFMFYGFVEEVVNNQYILDKFVLIPNMKNSGAYCESDEEKYVEFMQQFSIKDRMRVRVHAHSHVNMATNPSGTDDKEFMEKANSISNYYIQLIVNHKEENTINICDVSTGIKYEQVPQYIQVGKYIYSRTKKQIFTWDENNKKIGDAVKITDGEYTIKDNQLVFDDVLKYSFTSNSFILDGEKLLLTLNASSIYYISDDEEKEVEESFDKLIKKTTYATSSGYPTANNKRVSYTYDYESDYPYPYCNNYGYTYNSNKVWDSKLKKYVNKSENKNQDNKTDDDSIILEYYKKSLKGNSK